MENFKNNILNPRNKDTNKLNFNYFYITTLLFIGSLCLCYFLFEKQIDKIVATSKYYNIFFVAFQHANIGHLVGNIISFFLVSLFLERHFGSLQYLFIIILAIPLSSISSFLFSNTFDRGGESGVNYLLYAIMFIEVIFNMKSYLFTRWQNLFVLIIIASLLFIMCWNGDTSALTTDPAKFFKFSLFKDLTSNIAHWASMIMGTGVGLIHQAMHFKKSND